MRALLGSLFNVWHGCTEPGIAKEAESVEGEMRALLGIQISTLVWLGVAVWGLTTQTCKNECGEMASPAQKGSGVDMRPFN